MPRPSSPRVPGPVGWTWFALFALLFASQVVPRFWSDSLTLDEPVEITNGYYYWTQGDVATHHRHPPLALAWQAFPLLFLDLNAASASSVETQRNNDFFFVSNKRLGSMTVWPRFMTLLAGLGVGWLIFIAVRGSHPIGGVAALMLWAFDPTLLAFSGYAMADVPVTFLVFAAVLLYRKARENGVWAGLGAGAVAGLAACAKFSALALVPLLIALEFLERGDGPASSRVRGALRRWAWGILGFLLAVGSVYLPGTLLLPDHRDPYSYFVQGLRDMMGYASAHHPVYFMGTVGRENHWLYFPTAFLLKCPLPFVLLLVSGVVLAVQRKLRLDAWLWVPPAVLLIAVLPVQNLGVRYLLPAFPFLILAASRVFSFLWDLGRDAGKRWVRTSLLGLLVWQAGSVLLDFPRHLAYFNDAVPAARKPYWLGDSNLDMSQDHRRLAAAAERRGWKEVRLAYFGSIDPALYGVPWRRWTARDLKGPQPGCVYAVNVGFFQLGPVFYPIVRPIADGWIQDAVPTGRVADTWLYYEVPGEAVQDPTPWFPSAPGFSYTYPPVAALPSVPKAGP